MNFSPNYFLRTRLDVYSNPHLRMCTLKTPPRKICWLQSHVLCSVRYQDWWTQLLAVSLLCLNIVYNGGLRVLGIRVTVTWHTGTTVYILEPQKSWTYSTKWRLSPPLPCYMITCWKSLFTETKEINCIQYKLFAIWIKIFSQKYKIHY